MYDLFGELVHNKVCVLAFHDERFFEQWLYHGFIFVEQTEWEKLGSLLECYRRETNCKEPVHFRKLRGSSKKNSRTRLAVRWAKGLDRELLNYLRFSVIGVDISKLDRSLFGEGLSLRHEVNTRIYNRFFEIGSFSALRWFFTDYDNVVLRNIIAEERGLSNDDPFRVHAPYRINARESSVSVVCSEVEMLAAKSQHTKWRQPELDCLQMADVFTGGFSQVLDYSSKSKKGCMEVADVLLPRIRKMNENPYNTNSRAYKRLAMNFFPDKSIDEQMLVGERPYGMMYNKRSLSYEDRYQLKFPF